MGLLDEPQGMFTPKPRYKAQDNFKDLQNLDAEMKWGLEKEYDKKDHEPLEEP